MNWKEITTSLIAVLIVLGAIVSLFVPVASGSTDLLRTLAGMIVGFYFGRGENPLSSMFKKESPTN